MFKASNKDTKDLIQSKTLNPKSDLKSKFIIKFQKT